MDYNLSLEEITNSFDNELELVSIEHEFDKINISRQFCNKFLSTEQYDKINNEFTSLESNLISSFFHSFLNLFKSKEKVWKNLYYEINKSKSRLLSSNKELNYKIPDETYEFKKYDKNISKIVNELTSLIETVIEYIRKEKYKDPNKVLISITDDDYDHIIKIKKSIENEIDSINKINLIKKTSNYKDFIKMSKFEINDINPSTHSNINNSLKKLLKIVDIFYKLSTFEDLTVDLLGIGYIFQWNQKNIVSISYINDTIIIIKRIYNDYWHFIKNCIKIHERFYRSIK